MHNGCPEIVLGSRTNARMRGLRELLHTLPLSTSTLHAQLDSSTLIVSPFQSRYSANVITTPKNHPANNSLMRVSTASAHAHTKQRETHESGRFHGGDSSISCSAEVMVRSASCPLRKIRALKEDERSSQCWKRSEAEVVEILPEMRELTVERRKAKAEGLGVSDTARVALDGKALYEARSCDGEAGRAGAGERRPSGARGRFGDQGSVRSAGEVRKEWADTQEYESCQQNDMNVDVDENKEEVSFNPSAVSSSAGRHEPKFVCDRQCREKEFWCCEIASVVVEDDGAPRTIHLCRDCYNLRQGERKEPAKHDKHWKILIAGKRSRDKLSGGLVHAGSKI